MGKLRRVIAFATVVLIIVLIVGTLICAVTGSKYFYGMLALMFLVPIILWIFNWFTRLVNGNSSEAKDEEDTKIE